eukprot:gene3763-6737_t
MPNPPLVANEVRELAAEGGCANVPLFLRWAEAEKLCVASIGRDGHCALTAAANGRIGD